MSNTNKLAQVSKLGKPLCVFEPFEGLSFGNGDIDSTTETKYINAPPDISEYVLLTEYYYLQNRWVHVGPPPSMWHTVSPQLLQWELSNIAEARLFYLESLKASRDTKEFGPFIYNGMTFDGDLDAQRRLSGLVSAAKSAIAAGYSFTKDFTLADNSVVQLTAEDFIGIEMAKLWQVDVAFQEFRIKKAAIEAATTIEELEAITI